MILSDRDIKQALSSGRIKITPAPDLAEQLGSCSIDLHLGNSFRVFRHSRYPYIDLHVNVDIGKLMEEISITEGEAFIMQPGDFALASVAENVELANDILGRIEGRSSLGRLGIIVHGTASIFDPGWIGVPTMELGNLGRMPVALYPGMRICSMTFEQLSSPARVPYSKKKSAKYIGQKTALASKISQD